jgi:uncharacterized protein (TIGR02145 family)
MAIQVSSINFSGQTANVSIYAATGTTIPFSAATTINVGTQTMPFTYSSATISNEYGTFSCQFPDLSNKICTTSQLTPEDGDGNRYRTIKIGNQVWMSESLRTTKFQDKTTLLDNLNNDPVNNTTWSDANNTSSKYWAYVHDDPNSKAIEGLLYNQYAVTGSTQGAPASSSLCPAGWHIPTLSEANTFIANADSNLALRHPGFTYWYDAATSGTNTSGFNSLGSDNRATNGNASGIKLQNYFWTTSDRIAIQIDAFIQLTPIIKTYPNTFDERHGLSVRCIKD